ncbi:MAG TPA: LysM peptidoglycan-binding domain-containing M23 family metallopeptidase [Symbiobacteriaceae bacterium]|nr:LysM peptidoglycan-binding domain-containing M23 family metallopeptidase [Symbiobacteriaceae bacterium]
MLPQPALAWQPATETSSVADYVRKAPAAASAPQSDAAAEGDEESLTAFYGVTYTVQEGDTVSQIAADYEIAAQDVLEANGLDAEGRIAAGQVIYLPGARPRRNQLASRGGYTRQETPAPAAPKPAPTPAPAPAPAPAPKSSPAFSQTFIWPLTTGRYFSEFGDRDDGFHSGLDMSAPEGTPAVAAQAGTVVFAGWSSGYGNMVIIDHGNGVQTKYAHASALLVTVGTEVAQGQQVILIGSTGRSTGPHLHFEVVVDGVAKNPRNFLP